MSGRAARGKDKASIGVRGKDEKALALLATSEWSEPPEARPVTARWPRDVEFDVSVRTRITERRAEW